MPRSPAVRLFGTGAVALLLGCGGSSTEQYKRGLNAFRHGRAAEARPLLERFAADGCGPGAVDQRCRKAYVTLGRIYEKQGALGQAWAAYDSALTFAPHAGDGAVAADLERAQQALVDRQGGETARGPVLIRYRDEVTEEYNPRSVIVSLDFEAVLTKDKDASELHSAEFRKVYGGSVAAGEHLLLVEVVHDCRPSGGVRCVRSHVRKAWPFQTAAHAPTTVEIRAYAEGGDGDHPARPTLEVSVR